MIRSYVNPRNQLTHDIAVYNTDYAGKTAGTISRLGRWFCRAKIALRDLQTKHVAVGDRMMVPARFWPCSVHRLTLEQVCGDKAEFKLQLLIIGNRDAGEQICAALTLSVFVFRSARKGRVALGLASGPALSTEAPILRVMKLSKAARDDQSYRFYASRDSEAFIIDTTSVIAEFSYTSVRLRHAHDSSISLATSPETGKLLNEVPVLYSLLCNIVDSAGQGEQ